MFAGSVPLVTSAPATTRKTSAASPRRAARKTPAPRTAVPSESSAQASAWSGLGTSSEPALVGTEGVPGGPANGTVKTLSILMLSLGLAALAGGVGASELRRRRARGH